jgi:hypothetical protein
LFERKALVRAEKDPDYNHHKTELRALLRNALRAARRLPGKLQEHFIRIIEDAARRGGVEL